MLANEQLSCIIHVRNINLLWLILKSIVRLKNVGVVGKALRIITGLSLFVKIFLILTHVSCNIRHDLNISLTASRLLSLQTVLHCWAFRVLWLIFVNNACPIYSLLTILIIWSGTLNFCLKLSTPRPWSVAVNTDI